MESKNKRFYIKINEQGVEVSEEVYRAYIRPIRLEQQRKKRAWRCKVKGAKGNLVRCKQDCNKCPYAMAGNNARGNVLSLDLFEEEGAELEIENIKADILQNYIAEEEIKDLYIAIAQLTPRQQQLVKMIYFDEKSQEEVANLLGISQCTISLTLKKAIVRRAMLTGNFKPSMLYGLQIEGFKSANISPDTTLSKYERGINSSSLAAVFPFVRTCVMDEGGIMLGENRTNGYPFIFNLWKRGNLYQNSNAMIIGKSGSGKSYFLKNLILNEWANGTRIVVLDPEAEYLALTRNLYGNIIDVGNAKEGRINPFHIYKVLTEDGTPANPAITFNTHLKMLESFFKIVLADAPVDVIELINNLTVETYEKMGITENTDCSNFPADYFPLFSDLLDTLKEKDKSELDALTLRDMRTAELYLQKFVAGRYSDIWNSPSTLTTQASLIDFNFQSLFANKNNIVANAQMLLVFRFVEQEVINAREANKNGKNLRTMIVCDEAHLFIDAKFPIALDFFYSMSKRIRKYGGSFIPATQNIADWNANEELSGKTSSIIKNSQYTFIFKLSAPDMKDVLDVYSAGDSFNQEEQRMIISAVTGQAFFIGST